VGSKERGSITLEAAIAFPFFIAFVVFLIALIQLTMAQMAWQTAISEATKEVATYSYLYEAGENIWESLDFFDEEVSNGGESDIGSCSEEEGGASGIGDLAEGDFQSSGGGEEGECELEAIEQDMNMFETVLEDNEFEEEEEDNVFVKFIVLMFFRLGMNRYVEDGVIDTDEITAVQLKLEDNFLTIKIEAESQLLMPFFNLDYPLRIKSKERVLADLDEDMEFEIDTFENKEVELIDSLFSGDFDADAIGELIDNAFEPID